MSAWKYQIWVTGESSKEYYVITVTALPPLLLSHLARTTGRFLSSVAPLVWNRIMRFQTIENLIQFFYRGFSIGLFVW